MTQLVFSLTPYLAEPGPCRTSRQNALMGVVFRLRAVRVHRTLVRRSRATGAAINGMASPGAQAFPVYAVRLLRARADSGVRPHTQLHSARARVITDGRKNGEPEARHDATGHMPLPKVGENIRISYCKLTFHKFRSVACVLYVQFSLHKTLQSMPDHFENASSGPALGPGLSHIFHFLHPTGCLLGQYN